VRFAHHLHDLVDDRRYFGLRRLEDNGDPVWAMTVRVGAKIVVGWHSFAEKVRHLTIPRKMSVAGIFQPASAVKVTTVPRGVYTSRRNFQPRVASTNRAFE